MDKCLANKMQELIRIDTQRPSIGRNAKWGWLLGRIQCFIWGLQSCFTYFHLSKVVLFPDSVPENHRRRCKSLSGQTKLSSHHSQIPQKMLFRPLKKAGHRRELKIPTIPQSRFILVKCRLLDDLGLHGVITGFGIVLSQYCRYSPWYYWQGKPWFYINIHMGSFII